MTVWGEFQFENRLYILSSVGGQDIRLLTTAKALIQALLFCRLDYCNALLFGDSDTLVRRLQSVQNAVARLITGTRRRDHITPVLHSLHWLPVRRRIEYKMAVLVYKALRGQLPSYLSDSCHLVAETGARRLRSADVMTCSVTRTRTTFGDRGFAVAGPATWNRLPVSLRQPDIGFDAFRRNLKTFLFV